MLGELRVVDDVPSAFAHLVVQESPASVALCGGPTARSCYEQLAAKGLDWSRVVVFFGDERWVPVEHTDSNEGLARRALLDRVHPAQIHSMRDAGNDPDGAAEAYDRLLGASEPIELVHLGLGPDGHTASLFPGSPALDATDRLVVATGDDHHPHPRVTFTFPAIAHARLVVVTVTGGDKADALARVWRDEDLPAGRIRAARVTWLVDPDAEGRIGVASGAS